ncbi:MAG: DUF2232 domain-containing protein [Candidatus Methylomirabilia bacterium]
MMRISGELRDLAAASGLSALLFASGVLVPLLGPPAGFFSAAPLIWLAARRGWTSGLLGGLLATAALLPALPPPIALIFSIEHVVPAWFLGSRIRQGKSLVGGSAAAALVVTILMIGAALLLSGRGNDPVQVLEQQLREGLAELGSDGTGGTAVTGNPAALNASLEAALSLLRRVLPAVTLIGIFLECSLNSLLAARVLGRGEAAAPPRDLTLLRLPEWLVWVLIPALALCWAPQTRVATIALNAVLPLLFAYLLQGLSITLHLAARARLARFSRIMFASALVFFPWLLSGPLLLGLLDFRFDFRGRWPLNPPAA